ncbi:MAG TPA: hypothetical protein VJQ51_13415 [Burkholderiales bacterium]|nr:hypothetical protein [Burkholderiales bacterium]
MLVRSFAAALALAMFSSAAGAAADVVNDYSTPNGDWRGQAQFHARVGSNFDPKAHSVSDLAISIDPQGKVTGVSSGTGCRALGLAVPSGPKTVFNLDVTFTGCSHPGYNQRYSGNLFLYPRDSYASLRLRSYRIDPTSKSVSYDVRATLKR